VKGDSHFLRDGHQNPIELKRPSNEEIAKQYFQQAEQKIKMGNYQEAEVLILKALSYSPENPTPLGDID